MIEAFALICAVVSVAIAEAVEFPAPVPTTATVPSDVAPAKNVTLPVGGTPRLPELTVTTNVKLVFAVTFAGKVEIVENVGALTIVSGALTDELEL